MIDWEGMIVSTLYLGGCNFRCPFCYNTDLVKNAMNLPAITEEKVFSFLIKRKSFLDGICLSGGEPTIHNGIIEFLTKIKSEGLKVKLDTNGSSPEILAEIIENNLIDFVAMDIKNCLKEEPYFKTIGVYCQGIVAKVKKSIALIMDSGIDYEFRTTIVPGFHDLEMIEDIAGNIKGAQRYILQNFIQSEEMLDPNLKFIKPFSHYKMTEILKKAELYVKECRIR